eukprot:m51a1_g9838 hypothetical protein (518) ;mRNA; r:1938634-1940650
MSAEVSVADQAQVIAEPQPPQPPQPQPPSPAATAVAAVAAVAPASDVASPASATSAAAVVSPKSPALSPASLGSASPSPGGRVPQRKPTPEPPVRQAMAATAAAMLAADRAALSRGDTCAALGALATLAGRASALATAAHAMAAHLRARARAEEAYARAMAALPLPSAGVNATAAAPLAHAGLESALEYLGRVARTEAETGARAADSLSKDICRAADDVAAACLAAATSAAKRHDDAARAVLAAHARVEASHAACAAALEAAASASASPSVDPWVLHARFVRDTASLRAAQAAAAHVLQLALVEAEHAEAGLVARARDCAERALQLRGAAMAGVSTDVGIAASMFAGLAGSDDWAKFAAGAQLHRAAADQQQDPCGGCSGNGNGNGAEAAAAAEGESSGAELRSAAVVRWGELERSGMISWRKYTYVLTRFGFLHAFASERAEAADESVLLSTCVLEMTEPSKNSFQLVSTVPGTLFHSTKVLFLRAPSEEAMVDWVIAIKRFTAPVPALPGGLQHI